MKKLTTEEFIKKAKEKHGDKYDYSLVEYINGKIKVKIICKEHGIFEQNPASHLSNIGCSKCNGGVKSSNDEFINKSNIIHNYKFDYSLVEYKDNNTKVKIICPEHGIFHIKPKHHLIGTGGCKICNNSKLNTEEFIKRSNKLHGNKYDYSIVEYKNNKSKVKIICPIHGIFNQLPSNHLKYGCQKCKYDDSKIMIDDFIINANNIHNDKYDYSLVEYVNSNIKVKIICPIHGIFEQSTNSHIHQKQGCPKCAGKNKTTEEFIKECKKTHGNIYNYSLVEYINTKIKVKIICNKCNKIFEQRTNTHLNGCGCPICKESKGERKISLLLEEKNIQYIKQPTK